MFFPGQFARGGPARWPRRLSVRLPHLPSVAVDRRAVACGVATAVLVVEAAFGLWLAVGRDGVTSTSAAVAETAAPAVAVFGARAAPRPEGFQNPGVRHTGAPASAATHASAEQPAATTSGHAAAAASVAALPAQVPVSPPSTPVQTPASTPPSAPSGPADHGDDHGGGPGKSKGSDKGHGKKHGPGKEHGHSKGHDHGKGLVDGLVDTALSLL